MMKLFTTAFILAIAALDTVVHAGGQWKVTRHLQDGFILFRHDDAEGCLGVANGRARRDQKLVLSDEGEDLERCLWRAEDGLLKSFLDPNLCIQAGRRGATAKNGKRLRLFPCDENDPQQQFEYTGIVIEHRAGGTEWCVVFRGINGSFGDPIILKDCDESEGQDNWSTDGVI